MGVDISIGKIANMYEKGVVEPLSVKQRAIKSATESASMILRIDDVIAASKPKERKAGNPEKEEEESKYQKIINRPSTSGSTKRTDISTT